MHSTMIMGVVGEFAGGIIIPLGLGSACQIKRWPKDHAITLSTWQICLHYCGKKAGWLNG